MTTADIREKLYEYIRIADDEKVKAIYTILEDEITEDLEWWKDKGFMHELDQRYNDYKGGKTETYDLAEVEASIQQLKQKRTSK